MIIIKTSELKPGMVTAVAVRTKHDQELIPQGAELTKQLITRMEFYGISSACIDEASLPQEMKAPEPKPEVKEEPEQAAPIREKAYSQSVRQSTAYKQYLTGSAKCIQILKEEMEGFVFDHQPMDTEGMVEAVNSLIQPGQTVIQYFDMLHNMRSNDDSIYAHSVNVALISRMIGKWLRWSKDDLDELVLAGILHDTGKVMIPEEILNKEGKLTDEEFDMIKQHPQAGYNLIKNMQVDPRIKKATLMHHERSDGSGYPMGLEEIMIDDFALVIAIADVYDAMTAARKYRDPLCPFQVIDEFEKDGLHKFKPEYILTFLKKIATTYQNNRVILSNGHGAKIILLNTNQLAKPLVQLDDGSCVDLATSNLKITKLI